MSPSVDGWEAAVNPLLTAVDYIGPVDVHECAVLVASQQLSCRQCAGFIRLMDAGRECWMDGRLFVRGD